MAWVKIPKTTILSLLVKVIHAADRVVAVTRILRESCVANKAFGDICFGKDCGSVPRRKNEKRKGWEEKQVICDGVFIRGRREEVSELIFYMELGNPFHPPKM